MMDRTRASQIGKIGGLKRGANQQDEAVKAYLANPKICEECKRPIPLNPKYPPTWTRTKRFCNYACSASYNAKRRLEIQGKKPLAERTLDEVMGKAKSDEKRWWRARIHIGQHARRTYEKSGNPYACAVCGYSRYVEVCHRKPVSDFPGTALISEINNLSNLVPLCPNHHWELDHGLLKL